MNLWIVVSYDDYFLLLFEKIIDNQNAKEQTRRGPNNETPSDFGEMSFKASY